MTISSMTATATRVSRGFSVPPTATPTRMASALSASPARCLWEACRQTSTKVNGEHGGPSCPREAQRQCFYCLPIFSPSDEITSSFRRFGHLVVDWPHKAESKSYFPPKGSGWTLNHTRIKTCIWRIAVAQRKRNCLIYWAELTKEKSRHEQIIQMHCVCVQTVMAM